MIFYPQKYFKRFAWKFAWWQTWKTIENRSLRLKYSCCIDLNLQNWFWCRGLVEHWGVYCRKNEHYRCARPPRYSTGIDDDVIIRISWRCWKYENMKKRYFPEFVDLRILQWFAPISICWSAPSLYLFQPSSCPIIIFTIIPIIVVIIIRAGPLLPSICFNHPPVTEPRPSRPHTFSMHCTVHPVQGYHRCVEQCKGIISSWHVEQAFYASIAGREQAGPSPHIFHLSSTLGEKSHKFAKQVSFAKKEVISLFHF